jgi:hypothetical protein
MISLPRVIVYVKRSASGRQKGRDEFRRMNSITRTAEMAE